MESITVYIHGNRRGINAIDYRRLPRDECHIIIGAIIGLSNMYATKITCRALQLQMCCTKCLIIYLLFT